MRFPFLGRVKAAGLPPLELERKLVTLLSDGYLKRPQVAVTVKQYRSQPRVRDRRGGPPRPLRPAAGPVALTLLKDVGELTTHVGHEVVVIRAPAPSPPPVEEPQAGSPFEQTEHANGNEAAPESEASPSPSPSPSLPPVSGLPGEVPGSQIFRVNLREMRAGYPGKDMRLEVGDTVYFPKAAQIYVTGHVARPGAYRFEEGLTVFQALAAGRQRHRARVAKVQHHPPGGRPAQGVQPKMTDLVSPEDTLHVPERFF